MAASRNRLFAGFANNVVDNDNSITLDSASIGNIDITDNSIMGTVGGGGVLNIGVNGIPGIKLFNPGAGPDYVGLTHNGGLKLYTTSTGVRISNSGDEFFAPGGSLIADSATLTNLTLNGELVDSAWVAARGGGGGGGASVTVSSSAPSSPSEGDLWFDDENATLLIYYDDGNGAAQWLQSVAGPSDFGLDSAEAIAILDSAYVQARAGSPTTIQPAATSSTDTEVFPLFVETSNTDVQDVKVDGGLKYNASTNVLTADGGVFVTNAGPNFTEINTYISASGNIVAYRLADGTVSLQQGHIEIEGDGSSSAYIDLYCEVNTHKAKLTAPPHSAFSGDILITLPANSTTLAGLGVAQSFTQAQTFSSTSTFNGTATFNANMTLGNASSDAITVNGTTTFNTNVTATDTITAADFVSTSDRRLKDNIQTIDNAINKVKQLRGVTFDKDNKNQLGVIAQEVQEVIPQVVSEANDSNGTLSVAYGNIVGLLIEAIKDQQAQIEELKLNMENK